MRISIIICAILISVANGYEVDDEDTVVVEGDFLLKFLCSENFGEIFFEASNQRIFFNDSAEVFFINCLF